MNHWDDYMYGVLTGSDQASYADPDKVGILADEELGALPAIPLIGPALKGLGGILGIGGRTKSKGSGSVQASGSVGLGGGDLREIIKSVVMTIPSPVRDQVKQALTDWQNGEQARAKARLDMAGTVDATLQPKLKAALGALKTAQLQRLATSEHNSLKKRNQFRKRTGKDLKSILLKLDRLERQHMQILAALGESAVIRGKRPISIWGGAAIKR